MVLLDSNNMEIEDITRIIEQTLVSPYLSKINSDNKGDFWKKQLKIVLSGLTSGFTGALEREIQAVNDYRTGELFRKFVFYVHGLKETTSEERHMFADEIRKKAEDAPGNVIAGMIDRLDNINKQEVFAKLTIARIHGFINVEDFLRLHSLLERIPYVDLAKLPYYNEDYYDESGDTELLFATGALKLASISAEDGNKYVLSALGENLLRFGIGVNIDVKRERGTELEPRTATKEDIDELFKV